MVIDNIDENRPGFYLFPVNNNRTAWRPFGLPVVLVVPRKRDATGSDIPDSTVFNTKIYVENVPQSALVAGHDHIGLRYPDRELYSQLIKRSELNEIIISLVNQKFSRDGIEIEYSQAKSGDYFNYVTFTGVVATIKYLSHADYYDLSNIQIDVETLPSDIYNLVYETEYYNRAVSDDDKNQFLCIDSLSQRLALFKFVIQHPGQVLEEFYRHTPAIYLTNANKSQDTTIAFYRPFTDILQDIMDEQGLLERVNWVYDAPAEIIPYASSLLGWDLPYFPRSLDQLRRAVLRRTVEFQNLKGSKRSLINIFRLFGFEVLISNLWWSTDGKLLIRPGNKLPTGYEDQQITIKSLYQIDNCVSDQVVDKFGSYDIPLLYRPQQQAGLDDFYAIQDGGNITVEAYSVYYGSEAWAVLNRLSNDIANNPQSYGQTANCVIDDNGYINSDVIRRSISGTEIVGYSQILLSGLRGEATNELLVGRHPPISDVIRFDRATNVLHVNLNGYFDPQDNIRIFILAYYERQELLVPDKLAQLQSNRFDIQVLTKSQNDLADPITLEFAIEFLYRLKAFHSLLNVIRTRIDNNETYQVTDLCIGGDYEQRYDTMVGSSQVPPAIIPNIPNDVTECAKLDPTSLGYKQSDLLFRQRVLNNLLEEHGAWKYLDIRANDNNSNLLRLAIMQSEQGRLSCLFTSYGQDRVNTSSADDLTTTAYIPSPNTNQSAIGYASNTKPSPINDIISGNFYSTGEHSTSNNDSHQYGPFNVEYTDRRVPQCNLDGINDYCYKGRVEDQVVHQSAIINLDLIRNRAYAIGMGSGVYWTYPTITVKTTPGVSNPASRSKSQIVRFSGLSPRPNIQYYRDGIQGAYLSQPSQGLTTSDNSWLGRLYREYVNTSHQTLHYSNRQVIQSADQTNQLALQRPNLDISKPTLHLPGCRFPTMNGLVDDMISSTWLAKPWDDAFNHNCGPRNICHKHAESPLNYHMMLDDLGNELLVYDSQPYTVYGNGRIPDISSLGLHIIDNQGFTVEDVIHKVYMNDSNTNPAIVLDQVCEYDDEVNEDGQILTDSPIFSSHSEYEATEHLYKDFADGYACSYGFKTFSIQDLDRSGLYAQFITAAGLHNPSAGSLLFALNSGIRVKGIDIRLDCGINHTHGVDLYKYNHLSPYFSDGKYDWDCDHLQISPINKFNEYIGINDRRLDGAIPSMLDII